MFHIDTETLDQRSRVEAFEHVAANICKLSITPLADQDYRSSTMIRLAGEAAIADTRHSGCLTRRDTGLAAATGDNILLHVPLAGGFRIRQTGGDLVECGVGSVYVDPTEMPGDAWFEGAETHVLYLSLPRDRLAAAGGPLGAQQRTAVTATPQWRLLAAYARSLHAELPQLSAAEASLCAGHLQDLAVLAFGAARDAVELAAGRGLRAARLRAVKADIARNLTSPELAIDAVAARQGISPRYVRALFADEGSSFGDHVARCRLDLVRRRLADPRLRDQTILKIATEAGFGDLSWFNARFRRAFGMTPREARAAAYRDG